ncbi:PKD domain-containing protein [Kribbella sp. NPDC048915]|uniref:PKD domain-containing protein n=1 Tax=Kribbella sp. NPDC048915 TaxID=3155148 RepID=UPI0033EF3B92
MTRIAHAAAVVVAVALCTTGHLALDLLSSRVEAHAKTPSPKVEGKRTSWGASLKGSSKKPGRLKPKKLTPTRNSAKQPRKSKPAAIEPQRPRQVNRQVIRMNIGICGRMQPDGTVPGPARCQPGGDDERRVTLRTIPPEIVRPRPQDVTWEEVLSETKNIMFPGLAVKVQPNGRTLVNLDTIVYTDDSKVSSTTVTLLGFPVVVEATPISYTWRFGDGSPALTTSTSGKPYPAKDITHKYMKRGGVQLTLTTNYAARFNVADTGWQYVDGTVPITGPATPLQVREAVPVLVDPGR